MKQNYRLIIGSLKNDEEITSYKDLLQKKWHNNVYYSVEHLQHFEKNDGKLYYFLLENEGEPIIIMPFILREIYIHQEKTPYYDIISPYGYSGPLYDQDTITDIDIHEFWKQVDVWYSKNNVIAEFVRFSLNENRKAYSGTLIESLSNVRGQLLDNFDDQWTSFLSKVRNNYRKATSYNLTFKVYHKNEISKDTIRIFNDIYIGTMSRNNATSAYFFSKEYFENLILSNRDNFSLAIAYYNDIPISIELIISYRDTIFAFLGGTDAEYFSYRPNDFLRVEIIDWAIKNKIKYYVLGGGMKNGDGLYKNKKALFPKDEDVIFYTGRKIVNQKVYDELCMTVDKEYKNIPREELKNHFFPFYRSVT